MKKGLSRLLSSFTGSSCKSKPDVSPLPIFSLPLPISPKEETQYSPVRPRRSTRAPRETPEYLWRKEEKWHVVVVSSGNTERTTIEEYQHDDDDREKKIPLSIIELEESTRLRPRTSTSSRDSSCCITSEDEENDEREYFNDEETSTLLASVIFAAASSSNRTNAKDGKAGESCFAVVKESEDPRGDFRRSMAEMVADKGMYEANDLEQLLHCFLSLNSRRHHRDIVAAFADIWESLFPENPPTKNGYKQ